MFAMLAPFYPAPAREQTRTAIYYSIYAYTRTHTCSPAAGGLLYWMIK